MSRSGYTGLGLLVLIVLLPSCLPDFLLEEVDCSECYINRPEEAELIVKITKNEMNPVVPVVVYRGRLEARDTVILDTLRSTTEYIMVPTDQYYTVQAKYHTSTGYVYAIDGDELKAVKITGQCDGTCWIIKGGILNNGLKYDHPMPKK